jgi:hypothetical protein
MTLSAADIKTRYTVESYFRAHGSTQDAQGRWRCLCANRHHNGDADHSCTIQEGWVRCWSQGCFGDKGADIFAVVGVIEHLPDFKDQKRRVMELAGVASNGAANICKVRRAYRWEDAEGNIAYKIRWDREGKDKCSWARDPEGRESGKGACQPTCYHLSRVQAVPNSIFCEGELDADTVNTWLAELNLADHFAATTTAHGASDVKPAYLAPLIDKTTVVLSGDNDPAGHGYVKRCGALLHGHVHDLRHIQVSEDVNDWTEWKERGATAADFERLLDAAPVWTPEGPDETVENSIRAYRPHPPHESNFHPVPADQFLSEPPEQVDYVWDEYLAVGGFGVIAGKPKEGKTTLCFELAVKVALGLPFLGRQTQKCGVLILSLEEHAREVRMRLRNLGATELPNLFIHVGPMEPTATVLNGIKFFAQEHGVRLILIDTLSAFWKIENENDAAEMTKVVKPLLDLARESGACVLLIHHARKSDGQYGDEIRGSGALFAAVDVALIIKRHEVQTQRLLQAQSRYPETPSELVVELRETGYVALGDPASTGKAAKLSKMIAALTDTLETVDTIATRAGLSKREGHRLLEILVKEGKAIRTGKGVKGDQYRFCRNSIHAGSQSIGHESNSLKPDSIHAAPPSPCTNGIVPNVPEETGMTKIPTPHAGASSFSSGGDEHLQGIEVIDLYEN